MFPLGLWSVNLCMVSSCGFRWWSPFAELDSSLIRPTSLTRLSLNYKSIQRCSWFSIVKTRPSCDSTSPIDLTSSFSFPLQEARSRTRSLQWVGIVWTFSHQDHNSPKMNCDVSVANCNGPSSSSIFLALAWHFWSFSPWWKLSLWNHTLTLSWCPEPLIPSLLTLPHAKILFLPPISIWVCLLHDLTQLLLSPRASVWFPQTEVLYCLYQCPSISLYSELSIFPTSP